jgi:hypothetical protein
MAVTTAENAAKRRWRGLALELVYAELRRKGVTYDDVMLWSNMQGLGQTLALNDVIFILRQLKDRAYLGYQEYTDRRTGETRMEHIRITTHGQNLVEQIEEDPAVLIL